MRTFSIGFEERAFDELGGRALVAERYGTDHHELVLRPDAVELLPALAEAFDEPFADSSALPTYLVSQLAAEHVKVALSGEGGDELFGGYYTYVADLLAPRVGPRRRRRCARSSSGCRARRAEASFDYKAKRFVRAAHLPPLERHHGWKEIFSADARAELLAAAAARLDPLDFYRARFAETEGAELLARLQDVDLGIYLVDDLLVKTDRACMAHSLEARVPFLDTVVAEFALALPTPHKVRGLAKKRLLRKAVAPLLPARDRRTARKRGLLDPGRRVAARRAASRSPRDCSSPERAARAGLLPTRRRSPRLLDDHVAGREDRSRQLWGLLAFTLWHERYASGPQRRRQ